MILARGVEVGRRLHLGQVHGHAALPADDFANQAAFQGAVAGAGDPRDDDRLGPEGTVLGAAEGDHVDARRLPERPEVDAQ